MKSSSSFVLSTMTTGVAYTVYQDVAGLPTPVHKVLIHGGAGIPSLRSGFGEVTSNGEGQPVWTADGMITPVSDSDLALLLDHHVFKQHLEKGLVKVLNKDIRGNHKEVRKHAAGMEADGFRPLTPETLKMRIKVSTESMKPADEFRV